MGANASANRFGPPDLNTYLQPEGSSAVTSDGASTNYISLDKLSAYWNSAGDIAAHQQFDIAVYVSAIDFSSTDETYDMQVQCDSASNFPSASVVERLSILATGWYHFGITREMLKKVESDPAYLRLYVDVDGTTPSITYVAYVAPYPNG